MKQFLLKYPIWIFVLLIAASCNNDDDDNGGPSSSSSATFSGTRINTSTGAEMDWTASSVSAEESLFGDLTITVNEGSDVLQIKLPSLEVRQYAINFDEPFGDENFFLAISSTDTTLYAYEFTTNSGGQFEVNGGGAISITSVDTVAKTFDGNVPGLVFYNLEDTTGTDRFILQNATFADVPYTEETFDFGGGDDELSLTVDGSQVTFPNLSVFSFGNVVSITGSSASVVPSFTMSIPSDLSTGSFNFGGQQQIVATYTDSNGDAFVMSSGSLVVTSNANDVIEGTFSGTATGTTGSVSITNGVFSAGY